MEMFDQTILETPQIPSPARCILRLNLIEEELRELRAAYSDGSVTESADALVDLMYVVVGAALETGLGDKFEKLFEEVHRSNMSKACTTLEEALRTQESYGIPCNIRGKIINGKEVFLVFRKEDNKLLKSINYSAANLIPLL